MENFEKMKESLKTLVSFPSVQCEATENKPFGEGVYNALKYFLDLANSFGFETINYDNYIGEVVFGVACSFARTEGLCAFSCF